MAIQLLTNLDLEAEPSAPQHVVNVRWVEDHVRGSAIRKHAANITGNGTAASFPVNHDLDTSDVSVSLRNATSGATVLTDMAITSSNTVTINFAAPPSAGTNFRVVIIG